MNPAKSVNREQIASTLIALAEMFLADGFCDNPVIRSRASWEAVLFFESMLESLRGTSGVKIDAFFYTSLFTCHLLTTLSKEKAGKVELERFLRRVRWALRRGGKSGRIAEHDEEMLKFYFSYLKLKAQRMTSSVEATSPEEPSSLQRRFSPEARQEGKSLLILGGREVFIVSGKDNSYVLPITA